MVAAEIAPSRPLSERFGSWPTRLFVLLLFSALTIGMTYPLILSLETAVPGPPWDNMVWLYDLWWFRHSIVDLGQWPLFNPTIFHPFGYDLRLSETMLANKALIAPFLFWGNEVLAYNALLLLSFVLTGYATYLLVAYLTGNQYAAVIAGAILAFCPYRMHAMAAGWAPLISTQWIPLAFLYVERTLRERKAGYALAAGFFIALNFLCSWYYLIIVGLFLVIYLLIRVWPWGKALRDGVLWRNLVLMACVVVLMVAPVALLVIQAGPFGGMSWGLADVEKWAASLEDFFLPNVYHPLWGNYFLDLRGYTTRYPWYAPGFVYLGAVALLLALVGLIKGLKKNVVGKAMLWVGIISFVLALGVVLHWNNEVVEVPVSPRIEHLMTRVMSTLMSKWAWHKASYYDILFGSGTVPVPLPGLLVYLFVPLGNALRTLYRFGVMTIFSVAVLGGMGAARLLGGLRLPEAEGASVDQGRDASEALSLPQTPRRPSVGVLVGTVLILGLVLLDFWSAPLAYGLSEIRPQPVDSWLSSLPKGTVVMQFPLVRAFSGDALYRTRYHQKDTAYGHGTFYPKAITQAMPILGNFPSPECLDLLKSWGVTHVVVGSGAYDAGWGDLTGQTWETMQGAIEASGRLHPVGVVRDEPFWRDERVSGVLYGNPPVVPVLVDQLHLYELR